MNWLKKPFIKLWKWFRDNIPYICLSTVAILLALTPAVWAVAENIGPTGGYFKAAFIGLSTFCFVWWIFIWRFVLGTKIKQWENTVITSLENYNNKPNPDSTNDSQLKEKFTLERQAILDNYKRTHRRLILFKCILPTAVIGIFIMMFQAISIASASVAAWLGICGSFWAVAVAVYLWAISVKKKP